MTWEATISTTKIDSKGNEKVQKQSFVLDGYVSFGEVEEKLFDEFASESGFEVCAIRQSRIKEIANGRSNDDDLLWVAELQDLFTDENGNEKMIKYKILFFSRTFDTAKAFISNYAEQGYNLVLVSLKLTKFIDVL